MPTIGIMAGFGPLAGAHFYRRLVELTAAADDDDHLPVILMTEPGIPSRIAHLEGRGPSPLPHLRQLAVRLEKAGAELIVIPSATVHAYWDDIQHAVGVPVLHLPRVVMDAVSRRGRRAALLATTPTVRLGLYRDVAATAGVALQVPDGESQRRVMEVVARVKAGETSQQVGEDLWRVAEGPWAAGADVLVLGCTELPAIFPAALRGARVIDATDELARATLRAAGREPR